MKTRLRAFLLLSLLAVPSCLFAQSQQFRAVAFYFTDAEGDHVLFAQDAVKFFGSLAEKDNFVFDTTTDWHNLNETYLKNYQLVLWLNGSPTNPDQRRAFEKYMESGGAWLGLHFSGYNDKDTGWPWFVDFLGGAVFYTNSWPPLPAKLMVDDHAHPVAASLPDAFLSPANEWYIWQPSPRLNQDVRVLLTLDPSNYPLGFKDILTAGDLPVVWSNCKYKMVYMNMGHGDKIFTSSTQNKLFENVLLWLGGRTPAAQRPAPPPASGLRVSVDAVAVNPQTGKVYAVNPSNNTTIVVEPKTRSATSVKVGDGPLSIAINPQTNRIYVANSDGGTVSVIDGATDQVVATVTVGALPTVIAANPATNKVYVSHTFSNSMAVIDGASNTAANLEPGIEATAIAVNPVTNRIYMVSNGKNVFVLGGPNDSVSKIPTAGHLWGLALNPATHKIYAGNTGGPVVAVVDATTKSASEVTVGQIPCAIAVDASAGRVYVANYASHTVSVLDAATDAVLAEIEVAAHPQAIAVNPATHMVFALSTRANSVTVIDGVTNKVAADVSIANGPYAIAVDTANNQIFVESISGDHLTRIDGTTLTATPVIPSAPAR
jgi:uncharacterized protein